MKSSRLGKFCVLLMLFCAGAQPALGSSLIASALALGIDANDHAHSVVLHSDGGHIDVVLTHGKRGAHEHGGAPSDHDHPASFSDTDHVVHVAGCDAARATARRANLQAPLALAASPVRPVVVAPVWSPSRSLAPRTHGVAQQRTIVLRL